jgi:hypothetical protein
MIPPSEAGVSDPNTEYEQFVQGVFQTLLKADGIDNVTVQHDIELPGRSGHRHQIDVYWEFIQAGVCHKVAVECKNYSKPIEVGRLRDFDGLLKDVPGLRGIMVTRVGYQKGAELVAKHNDIGLRIVRPAEASDYKGPPTSYSIMVRAVGPEEIKVHVEADLDWIREHLSAEDTALILGGFTDSPAVIQMRDGKTGERFTLQDLIYRLPILEQEKKDPAGTHSQTFKWDEAYLHIPKHPEFRLKHVSFTYRIGSDSLGFGKAGRELARALIKDVLTGSLFFIAKDGHVTSGK